MTEISINRRTAHTRMANEASQLSLQEHKRSRETSESRSRENVAIAVPNRSLTPTSSGDLAPQLPALPTGGRRGELRSRFLLDTGQQPWTCRVESVLPDRFTAISRLPSGETKRIRFMRRHVQPQDSQLLVEGATFYWAFGTWSTGNESVVGSMIVFRRPPRIQPRQFVEAYDQAIEFIRQGDGTPASVKANGTLPQDIPRAHRRLLAELRARLLGR
jgi:hypothetical protein